MTSKFRGAAFHTEGDQRRLWPMPRPPRHNLDRLVSDHLAAIGFWKHHQAVVVQEATMISSDSTPESVQ